MLVPILISAVLLILIVGLFSFIYLRLKQVELDFRIFQAEAKSQLNRMNESLQKQTTSIPGARVASPLPLEDDPISKQTKSSVLQRFKRSKPALASDRLMPSDLFDVYPLWRRILGCLTHPWLINAVVMIALVAVPFLFTLSHAAAIWAVAASGLMWLGLAQNQIFWRVFSIVLTLVAIGVYIIAPMLLTAIVIGVSLVVSGLVLIKKNYLLTSIESYLAPLLLGGAAIWFIAMLYPHIQFAITAKAWIPIGLIGVSLAALLTLIANRFWPHMIWLILPYALIPLAALSMMVYHKWFAIPSEGLGIIAWPVVMLTSFIVLKAFEKTPKEDHNFLHALWFLTLIAGLTWETVIWGQTLLGGELTETWSAMLRAAVPTVGLLSVLILGKVIYWPFQQHYKAYYWLGAGTLALYLGLWTIIVNSYTSGLVTQFRYYPMLSPLDLMLTVVFIGLALWIYWVQLNIKKSRFTVGWAALIPMLGLWFTAMGLRYAYHHLGVPFEWSTLFTSLKMIRVMGIAWGSFAALIIVGWVGMARIRVRR